MEFLTNACEYNESVLTEALTVQLRETQRRKNLIFVVVISLLLVFCLVTWIASKDSHYLVLSILCLFLYGMLYFNARFLPGRTAKLQVPRIQQKNGGLLFQAQFLDEDITVLNPTGEESGRVPYPELEKLVETEHLILLFNRDKHMILLNRDGFRGGSEADFWRRMNEKCPAVVPEAHRS